MIYQGKQKIWSDYQKEIPDDHWFYVRSCIRQSFFPASETHFVKIVRDLLGKDLYETPHHTTCGGIAYHSDTIPQETAMTIVARQFSLMTEAGYKNLVTSCITSFGNYCEILETWREFPELEARIREHLWKACRREFEKPEYIAHASDVIFKLRGEIAERARYHLVSRATGEPLRIVEHIGCHYSKMFPHKGIGGAEYPCVLSGMVESWGGQVIDYPERRHCCGFGFRQYLVKANRGYSVSNTHKKFESMEPYHPDAIITNCPGCPPSRRARPTDRTATGYLFSRTRNWPAWCSVTTPGTWDCRFTRWDRNPCSTRSAFPMTRPGNTWGSTRKKS